MSSWRRTNLDKIKNSKSHPVYLFIDDGGVLNDNSLRGPGVAAIDRRIYARSIGRNTRTVENCKSGGLSASVGNPFEAVARIR